MHFSIVWQLQLLAFWDMIAYICLDLQLLFSLLEEKKMRHFVDNYSDLLKEVETPELNDSVIIVLHISVFQ